MKTSRQEIDENIIARYTNQPPAMPAELRKRVEAAWGGSSVQLYAFADLDDALRLTHSWVALGPDHLAVVRPHQDGQPAIQMIHRFEITELRDVSGLSATTLTVLGRPEDPPLAVVRYTHRQRRAFETLRFVLEEQLEGRLVSGKDADREYAHGVARPIRDTQALLVSRRAAVLLRLLAYLRPYWQEVATGLIAAAVMMLVSLAPPYIAGQLIDRVIRPVQEGTLTSEAAAMIAWISVVAMAVVYVVRQAAAMLRLRVMAVVGERVAHDLRAELYEHIQRLSLSFFARKKIGSLITRVSTDTDRLWEFLAFGVVDVSLALVMVVGLSTVLVALDWRLGLLMTIPTAAFSWPVFRHGRMINPLFQRAWRKWSHLTDMVSDTISGVRVVRAFNQEAREVRRFKDRNQNVTNELNRAHRVWTTFWPLLMLAVHGTIVLVWAMAIPRLLGDGPTLSTGTFISFLLYATMFVTPIDIIGQIARTMNRATSSAYRVFEVLDTEHETLVLGERIRLEPIQGRVTFDNVTFGYDGLRQVIRSLSFDVSPGELIGIVGPSGGGKSTIVNLIARLYDVDDGAVLIDGLDVRQLDMATIRRQIGIVLQEPYLFHATILDNIRYGSPGASLSEVIAAARTANAHDFICKLPHGYETIVGERGQTLSAGERQRVSIARAILHDPRILILDEATSSVDTETERQIQAALERLIVGRTVFAIAHRLSTLRRASRLFVIADGKLVEAGSHQELLQIPNGRYKQLYEQQHLQ